MKSRAIAGTLCGIGVVVCAWSFRGIDPASVAVCLVGVGLFGLGCFIGAIGALL